MGLSDVNVPESALNAYSTDINVIANNIANVSTVGYQSSRVLFDDVLTQVMNETPPLQGGQGVEVQATQTQFTQGVIETTQNPLDFAVSGQGFFIVENPVDGKVYYTRDGEFSLDKNDNIVNAQGDILEGYEASASGTISPTLTELNLSSQQTIPAQATTTASLSVNLDPNDSLPTVQWASGFSSSSGPAAGSYDYSTPVTVLDSAGNSHTVTLYFASTGADSWNDYAVWNEAQPGATANYQYQQLSGMTFSTSGTLTSPTAAQNISLTWDPSFGATSPQAVSVSLNNSTQYGTPDATISTSANGSAQGALTSVTLNSDGTLMGTYSNGIQETLAQVVLAKFNAPTQLAGVGNNLYAQTYLSGAPVVATPGTGGVGTVEGSALEESNVNETTELTNLISAQQAFTENSTVIATTNEMFTTMIADAAEGA